MGPERIKNAAAAVNLPGDEKSPFSSCFFTVFSQFSVALNLGCFLHWIKEVVEETVWEGLKQTISVGERLPGVQLPSDTTGRRMI